MGKSPPGSRMPFCEAAQRAHKELEGTYKNKKDHNAFLNSLKTHAFPAIGDQPVERITSAEIRRLILDLRDRIPAGATKVERRIRTVFKWAVAEGLREDNPALPDLLALPKTRVARKHLQSLSYTKIPAFIRSLSSTQASITTKNCIEFIILTACRSGEAREATWEEFHLNEAIPVWIVPAARMKMGREHRVPLCDRVTDILQEQSAISESEGYIFPGMRAGRPLSDVGVSKLVKRIGGEITVHGFRTSFRTWAQEQTLVSSDVAEAALAHSNKSAVEAAYARSDLFERRASLMADWEAYCVTNKAGYQRKGTATGEATEERRLG